MRAIATVTSLQILFLIPTNAWTNNLQFMKGRGASGVSHILHGKMDDKDVIDLYRERLEKTFTQYEEVVFEHYDPNYSDRDRLRLDEDWVETAAGVYSGDWSDPSPCRGDLCDEQCDIPDDLKHNQLSVDVLEFLGIQRAQPLRVERLRGENNEWS